MRFFTLPTCTVTYGSLVPLLSFAINPCAQITAKIIIDEKKMVVFSLILNLLKKSKFFFFLVDCEHFVFLKINQSFF